MPRGKRNMPIATTDTPEPEFRNLARRGAEVRLQELEAEVQSIHRLFPELHETEKLEKLRANAAKARAARANNIKTNTNTTTDTTTKA